MAPLRYRTDLFKGTAEHYDRFRPPYPDALAEHLMARVPLGATGRVLDLACGTGQIAFSLAAHVGTVLAVDQEVELVDYGRCKSDRAGITNIEWRTGAAEHVDLDGPFDLVAIGNAFHRLDRDLVARRLVPQLVEGGCVALLWSGTPWGGDEPWQAELDVAVEEWRDRVGIRDRVPEGWDEVMRRDPHGQVLQRAGLTYEGTFDLRVVQRWSIGSLIGLLYSTSFLSQAALGRHASAFERDLRRRLLATRADGVFAHELAFTCELARRAVPAPLSP